MGIVQSHIFCVQVAKILSPSPRLLLYRCIHVQARMEGLVRVKYRTCCAQRILCFEANFLL